MYIHNMYHTLTKFVSLRTTPRQISALTEFLKSSITDQDLKAKLIGVIRDPSIDPVPKHLEKVTVQCSYVVMHH